MQSERVMEDEMLKVHVTLLETLCWTQKYSLEALYLLGAVKATAMARIAHEIVWCCFINCHGGAANNIPVDLYNYGAFEQKYHIT